MNNGLLPPVYLITTTAELERLVERLQHEPLLALDTESNSLYAYYERVCLIQLSTREQDYLIDPLAIEDMSALGSIMANPAIEIVFHAAEYDIACLKRDFGFEFNNIFDTMMSARVLGWERVGLSTLLDELFGVQQDKKFQRADWGQRPLSEAQQYYAQMDTHYLPALYDVIHAELQKQGAVEEAAELFRDLTRTAAASHHFDPEGYWNISYARKFTMRQMAMLKELYLWREEQAEKRNMPRFKIMTDEKLTQIVRFNPKSTREMVDKKVLNHNTVRLYGLGVMRALNNGRNAPPPQKPPNQNRVDTEIMQRHDLLKEWRKKRAQQRGVESDIIIRRETLWQIARTAPRTMEELADIEELGPWRRQQYGEEILRVLHEGKNKS